MSDLAVDRRDGQLWLTISREARRNALSAEVLESLLEAFRAPGDARVVMLGSVGEIFCSGADLVQMAPGDTGLAVHQRRGLLREVVLAMRACPVPVVVTVQGLCLAGGVGLVLGSDIVLASDTAAFGLPEVELGLWPFMVGALLGRHVSPKQAMELMLTGRRVPAAEALQIGLISRVVEADRLRLEEQALAAALAAKPPLAVQRGKAAFQAAMESTLA
ncbi:MAG: enoyl-CoA hydratase/isomerase family protein, partial [Actinomycetota bacterium]|nr:enoyl-CoA hydratase/isomerase family protein [Actinomycetota bacterium]